jgi:basic membrane protein A
MKMKHIKGFALAAVAAMTLAACGGSDDAASDTTAAAEAGADYSSLKVAVVYIGVPDDKGWTYQHEQGILSLESELTAEMGGEYATFDEIPANLGTYFGAAEEARYLSGIAAGKASPTGKLGYVAAFPIPEVIRGINAFTLGAQSVNPDATVQVSWTKTWFDPTIEKEASESLLDAGVDVLAMHQDTTAAGVAAEARGAKWVGYNSDVKEAAPAAWLTAPTWNWGPFYVQTAKAVAGGTCPNDEYYGSMADGMVTLASFGDSVDADTQALIAEKAAAIIDGSFAPFQGPVTDQDGNEVVAADVRPELLDLLGMSYFVKGVIGSPKG